MNKAILEMLEMHDSFYLTSHQSPDGDAIGSMLAMGTLLKIMGKKVQYLLKDDIPERFKFLYHEVPIQHHFDLALIPKHTVLIALDCSNWARTGWESLDKTSIPIINIDHHPDNDHFGLINWVDAQASATGELIFVLAKTTQALNDRALATALFVAIVTDTGGFRFSNTTAQTHRIAAELLTQDIDGATIIDQVLTSQTLNGFGLLKDVLQTAVIEHGIASMILKQADLHKYHLTQSNVPELINYIRSIEDVKIAILCTEQPDLTTKASLRSHSPVDISRLARQFNGGGHKLAAGCRLSEDVETSRHILTQQAQELLQEYV